MATWVCSCQWRLPGQRCWGTPAAAVPVPPLADHYCSSSSTSMSSHRRIRFLHRHHHCLHSWPALPEPQTLLQSLLEPSFLSKPDVCYSAQVALSFRKPSKAVVGADYMWLSPSGSESVKYTEEYILYKGSERPLYLFMPSTSLYNKWVAWVYCITHQHQAYRTANKV